MSLEGLLVQDFRQDCEVKVRNTLGDREGDKTGEKH